MKRVLLLLIAALILVAFTSCEIPLLDMWIETSATRPEITETTPVETTPMPETTTSYETTTVATTTVATTAAPETTTTARTTATTPAETTTTAPLFPMLGGKGVQNSYQVRDIGSLNWKRSLMYNFNIEMLIMPGCDFYYAYSPNRLSDVEIMFVCTGDPDYIAKGTVRDLFGKTSINSPARNYQFATNFGGSVNTKNTLKNPESASVYKDGKFVSAEWTYSYNQQAFTVKVELVKEVGLKLSIIARGLLDPSLVG